MWAGIAVVAGWLIRSYRWAAPVGILACLAMGGPLGLVGGLARRPGVWGLLARLVVPAGALLEPWALHLFTPWPELPWPERWASLGTGAVLTLAGVTGLLLVGLGERRKQSPRL